jgi:general secretion pathway protein D
MRGGGPGVALLPDQRSTTSASPLDAAVRPQTIAAASGSAVQDDRTSGISVVADEANNQLIITANAQEYKRIRKILEHVDVSPNQVLLETTIAEVTLNDDLKFGLRWFFQNEKNRTQFAADPFEPFTSQVIPGFSQIFRTPNVQITLNALSSVTDVNVKSSPSLMVLDNKTATLQVGDEVPIITQQATGVAVAGAPVVNSVQMRNTGVVLAITPRIGDNGRVLLDVEQEVSDAVRTTSSTIDSPTIQKRRVRTTVAVNDGESLILAGMIQDKATRTRDQVPFLGDVPVFGNLFKQKDDAIRRTELLIAITPRIVKNTHQVRSIAAEFRDKLNFTTRPTREAPPGRREQVDRLLR